MNNTDYPSDHENIRLRKPDTRAQMKKKRIVLLIDDSTEDRYIFRRYLQRDKDVTYEFLETATGSDALTVCKKHSPDCVLLDYHLPDMDGLEVLSRLRDTLNHRIPVILLTGQGDEYIAVKAMKKGATDYLVKGKVDQASLRRTIEEAIKRESATGETVETQTRTHDPTPRVLGERFLLHGQSKRGGMGTIFESVDLATKSKVAVKIMRSGSDTARRRFAREVRVLANLTHPAIVRYIAHGDTPEGDIYLVMEWLDGEDLAFHLRKHRQLGAAATMMIGMRACAALATAHGKGLVHRDIKPSNLFLPSGLVTNITLLDFGIVYDIDARTLLTKPDVTMGTPGYMAPEQVSGERRWDHRVDIFALGCVLYECLTERRYFDDNNVMGVLAKLTDPLYDARSVLYQQAIPQRLADIVFHMLARNADERPQSATEVLHMLERITDWPIQMTAEG